MNVVDFTQLVVLLAWLAQPAGMFAWMMAWTNWLRNVRTGDPVLLSPLELSFRDWLETGWRKSPLFVQLFHAFIAAFVPALAFVITSAVPEDTLLRLQPYFAFLGMIYLSYVGSQAWYQLTKAKPAAVTTVQNVFNQSAPGGGENTNETILNAIGAPLPEGALASSVSPRADPVLPLSPNPDPNEGLVGLVSNVALVSSVATRGVGSSFRGAAMGVTSTPAAGIDAIQMQAYSDLDLWRLRGAIDAEIQRRGGMALENVG
jgi:hypothetical protein